MLVLSLPSVKVADPKVTLPPVVPPPEREARELLKLLRSKTTPAVLSRIKAD